MLVQVILEHLFFYRYYIGILQLKYLVILNSAGEQFGRST